MKKLFGNIVLQSDAGGAAAGGRRNQPRVALDLGTALTGRFSPASQGRDFGGLAQTGALRRNPLMQCKDEWPRAPSGGLGMEVVARRGGGVTEFRLVHNKAYADVQAQFELAAESMQPEALIQHLQFNPYHISTLLQVSEIAKHQGDHAVAADLLERALFNVGRAAHTTFGAQLRAGRARLAFTARANRELWLAGWRYLLNLGMKGTWRTAYEWAKLLLALAPAEDPYRVALLLDALAIRGRQQDHFVALCAAEPFAAAAADGRWGALPNIQCSLALAHLVRGDEAAAARQLRRAVARYPWIFCRLAQEHGVDPIPRAVWGAQPPDDAHALLTELYMERARDLWNRPEALDLIRRVAGRSR
ncbi:hypothetical protein KEM52_003986 [Ascosphaera acerosa]|nr:hypothetical protein KEM52_003986 [Ascosphaera acerosa]